VTPSSVPCHVWLPTMKCRIFSTGAIGCVACTGPNTMKCQGC
jgi:hypothetical protein